MIIKGGDATETLYRSVVNIRFRLHVLPYSTPHTVTTLLPRMTVILLEELCSTRNQGKPY